MSFDLILLPGIEFETLENFPAALNIPVISRGLSSSFRLNLETSDLSFMKFIQTSFSVRVMRASQPS